MTVREILDDLRGPQYPGRQMRNLARLADAAAREDEATALLAYVLSKSRGKVRTLERDAVPVYLSKAKLDEIAQLLEEMDNVLSVSLQ